MTSAIYMDPTLTINPTDADSTIRCLLDQWPELHPEPKQIHLYVEAHRLSLWEIWSEDRFHPITVHLHPIQKFGRKGNLANVAIATDAIHHMTSGAIDHIAIASADTTLFAIFVKANEIGGSSTDHPNYLWINTSDPSTIRQETHPIHGSNRMDLDTSKTSTRETEHTTIPQSS